MAKAIKVASRPSIFIGRVSTDDKQPQTDTYLFVAPTAASAYVPVSGEVGNNTGVFVKAILANPRKSKGRYAFVKTETATHGEIAKAWEGVTGKKSQWITTSREAFANIWGPLGAELVGQYAWDAEYADWEAGGNDIVSVDELGIEKEDLIDLKQNFELLKDHLV